MCGASMREGDRDTGWHNRVAIMPQRIATGVLTSAIEAAIAYLQRSIGSAGVFRYKLDPNEPGEGFEGQYNLIRHAGVACCLLDHALRCQDARSVQTGEAALLYLLRQQGDVVMESGRCRAIFDKDVAKLGATALASVALGFAIRNGLAVGDGEDAELFGRYLMSQQNDDGRFNSLYFRHGQDFRVFESIYYPGETILALSTLADVTHTEELAESAVRGALFLARRYAQLPVDELPADHWLLIAIEDLEAQGFHSQELCWCASRIAAGIVRAKNAGPESETYATWGSDEGFCQAATRAEGLGAAAKLAYQHGFVSEAKELSVVLEQAVLHCLRCQVLGRNKNGSPADGFGGFTRVRGGGVIRMDYVQHGIGALYAALDVRQRLFPEGR